MKSRVAMIAVCCNRGLAKSVVFGLLFLDCFCVALDSPIGVSGI